MKNILVLFSFLFSILFLISCESSAEKARKKQIEDFQIQQIAKLKADSIDAVRKDARENILAEFKNLHNLGCTFDEAKRMMYLPQSKAKVDSMTKYLNRMSDYHNAYLKRILNGKTSSSETGELVQFDMLKTGEWEYTFADSVVNSKYK